MSLWKLYKSFSFLILILNICAACRQHKEIIQHIFSDSEAQTGIQVANTLDFWRRLIFVCDGSPLLRRPKKNTTDVMRAKVWMCV